MTKISRKEYIAERIEAAQKHLAGLTSCPKCGHTDRAKDVVGSREDCMQVDLIRCGHPWHDVQYSDGDYHLLAIGLPNKPHFDRDWIKRMQQAAYAFAVQKKLPILMKEPKFVYDGPSLPMLEVDRRIYRIQTLDGGKWQSLESEEQYKVFLGGVYG